MTKPSLVPLGELLTPARDEVTLEPEGIYRPAGIYSFGRGAFERQQIRGADTSYTSLFRLREDDFVVSRLNGWEGAVDVVSTALDGCVVSNEYPTFSINRDRLVPSYLRWISRWPAFWDQLVPRGSMVRRKRVKTGQLLEVEIPLPSPRAQVQIVEHLDAIGARTAAVAERLMGQSRRDILGMLPTFVDALIVSSTTDRTRLGELVDLISDTVHPGDDPSPATEFVGLQHIESHTGRCIGSDPLEIMKGRKFRYAPGDVIYGYLRPYLNKVWAADRHGLCSVDQYVLRPQPGVSPALVAHVLRSRTVLDTANALTHNLQLPRLRSGLLTAFEIPISLGPSAAALVSRLDHVRDQIVGTAELRTRQVRLAEVLLPAVLNETFRQPSYSRAPRHLQRQ